MMNRLGAIAAIAGGAATAISGVLVQTVVQPASTIPDTVWSYPWSADAFVPVSLVYAVFHLIVFAGVLGFARSRAIGTARSGRVGAVLALAGTAVLLVAELASIPIRYERFDATGPAVIGPVFGLGVLLSGVGFLLAGWAVLRAGEWHGWRRFVPLATGVWTTVLVGVSLTKALPTGVAIYGTLIFLLGVALYPAPAGARRPVTRATVVS